MHIVRLLTIAFASGASALPVVTLPWFGHISLDGLVEYLGYMGDVAEDRTIYQKLKGDQEFSRLVKAIDLSDSAVDLLNDPSFSITFFAVPNSGLPCHHELRRGDQRHDENFVTLGDLVQHVEELEQGLESPDKKKRKELLARIVHKIIAYHTLPESYGTADLVQNSSYATALTLEDGSMDSEPQRLSILSTSLPPRLRINMLVEVTKRDIKAQNVFQETFFVPEVFSFFTSAVQHVGLRGAIDRWRCRQDDGHDVSFLGATAITVFAPTSGAFKRLPRKLRRYLFSPFGKKALKKLLEYHIAPNLVLHTDYFHNATSNTAGFDSCFEDELETQFGVQAPTLLDEDMEDFVSSINAGRLLELVYEYNATVPTLLSDHHLWVHVARYRTMLPLPNFPHYVTSFKVNGHRVGPSDIPARNGALHVVSTILDPRKGRNHHTDNGDHDAAWEDWEEWLPQWAMEN